MKKWLIVCLLLCLVTIFGGVLVLNPLFKVGQQQRRGRDRDSPPPHSLSSSSKVYTKTTSTNPSPTHAVVHMGIHKTGSSSIQFESKKRIIQLREDGYEMPWVVHNNATKTNRSYAQNQALFANCFLSEKKRLSRNKPCSPELLLSGLEIAKQQKNIFISAEAFCVVDEEGMRKLSTYLSSHWDDVTIVIYHRRFYDWLGSVYNQVTKSRKIAGDKSQWESSILEFLTKHISISHEGYTASAVPRIKDIFGDNNVVLANMNEITGNGDDLVKYFYCDAMPNAYYTCASIIRDGQQTTKPNVRNPSRSLYYEDLAYGAKKAGLINIQTQAEMDKISKAIQHYQEKILSLTPNDFKRKCLPEDTMDMLWEKSLEYEKYLFPNLFDDSPSLGEAELRADFESKIHSTSLCTIYVDEVLKEEVWQVFFKSFGGQQ